MSIHHFRSQPRRGVILVIVVACLALFLAVGIAFLFYANQQATSMRYQREAANGGRAANVNQFSRGYSDEAPPQAVDLFNLALGQLIYDVPDDESGYYSAMRGHSLARAMYGWNPAQPAGNTVPYNGIGRVHSTISGSSESVLNGQDSYNIINYTRYPVGSSPGPIRNPEFETTAGNNVYIAKNAPYTYPDENNCYLAAVRPSDGKVLVPSFHRPWLTSYTSPNKYMTLRAPGVAAQPVNPDGTTFGDVENLEGKKVRQLDSVWIDLDAPVRTWRGRNYKPLFAFLVMDFDGRMNVNVAGNIRSPSETHISNQGWGPWEMDLDSVLANNQGKGPLVLDSQQNLRRYGLDKQPTKMFSIDGDTTSSAPSGTAAPFYSGVDFDAGLASSPTDTPMKTDFALAQYRTSPTWAPRYQNGGVELANHPLLYNPYYTVRTRQSNKPSTPFDLSFGPEEMFFLNYKINGGKSQYYDFSDLGKCASRLTLDNPAGTASDPNPRFLVTTFSNGFQLPATRPWRPASGGADYNQPAWDSLPTGGPIDTPAVTAPSPKGPASDFDDAQTWRSKLPSLLGSIDLNRKLTDYRQDPTKPHDVDMGGGTINGTVNYAAALRDRQRLAQDIFDRLAAGTGAWNRLGGEPLPAPGSGRFDALRRLAQIAVNIVDYIDNDDYMTYFVWNPVDPNNPNDPANMTPANLPDRVVFGTELPRLVINEVYSNWDNDPEDPFMPPPSDNNGKPYAKKPYRAGLWVELHNPLTPPNGTDPNLSHGGGAPLVFKAGGQTNPVYQLVISKQPTNWAVANNVDGHPDQPTPPIAPLGDLNDGNFAGVVPPSNAQKGSKPAGPGSKGGNPGFYIVGPKNVQTLKAEAGNPTPGPGPIPGNDNVLISYEPKDPNNGQSSMMWTVPLGTMAPLQTPHAPTEVLLRRLLCPHLPPNPKPDGTTDANQPQNPYITVDYVTVNRNQVYDHRAYLPKDENQGANDNQVKFGDQRSYGRNQPHAGAQPFYVAQTPTAPPTAGEDTYIRHTFYEHNNPTTASRTFDWLVHLDRSLISAPEIMCVSAWKPHELTQRFIQGTLGNPVPQAHLADWKNSDQRLYRALGLLDTRSRTYGMPFGGRLPGQVNINTVWDDQVLKAVWDFSDSRRGTAFTDGDVTTMIGKLFAFRSPTILNGNPWAQAPLADQPLMPPAESYTTAGDTTSNPTKGPLPNRNVSNTILRPGLFESQNQAHPYLKNEMLTKVFGNITTRSNTFAVFCTIGYFEVSNSGPYNAANRPILGPELGMNDGTSVRHKFFALVDRSNLSIDMTSVAATPARYLQGDRPVFLSFEPVTTDLKQPDVDTTAPNATVKVRVPASGTTAGGGVTGRYDGASYTISAGDTILLDVGANQETATVAAVQFQSATVGADITLNLQVRKPHARGCVMQLKPQRSQLGNPGPQPGFNYKDPRYVPVVPFVAQIN